MKEIPEEKKDTKIIVTKARKKRELRIPKIDNSSDIFEESIPLIKKDSEKENSGKKGIEGIKDIFNKSTYVCKQRESIKNKKEYPKMSINVSRVIQPKTTIINGQCDILEKLSKLKLSPSEQLSNSNGFKVRTLLGPINSKSKEMPKKDIIINVHNSEGICDKKEPKKDTDNKPKILRPNVSTRTTKKLSKDEFIIMARQIHGDKYNYDKVIYTINTAKVIIICPEHGEFNQTPGNHLRNHGCPQCGVKTQAKNNANKYTFDDFVKSAREKHGLDYDYECGRDTFKNLHENVTIKCNNCNNIFEVRPEKHIGRMFGCKKCSMNGVSKISIRWLDYIAKIENIKIQHGMNEGEYKLPDLDLKVDGYCYETNTVYEFHGCVYHGCIKCFNANANNAIRTNLTNQTLYDQTLQRDKRISRAGYKLINLWEHDAKKMNFN